MLVVDVQHFVAAIVVDDDDVVVVDGNAVDIVAVNAVVDYLNVDGAAVAAVAADDDLVDAKSLF